MERLETDGVSSDEDNRGFEGAFAALLNPADPESTVDLEDEVTLDGDPTTASECPTGTSPTCGPVPGAATSSAA